MYKIRITGLIQGTKLIDDKYYAVGFKTKWGTAWWTPRTNDKFLANNTHLWPFIDENVCALEDFVGRYLWVSEREKEFSFGGYTERRPVF